MSDIIVLNEPSFKATIPISSPVTILDQITKVVKFDRVDENNEPNIKKLANFTEWKILIFQEDRTDLEWQTLKDYLIALNTGLLYYFYPDTVDNPLVKYLSYFFFVVDEINEDEDFIWCWVLRYYSNSNEA